MDPDRKEWQALPEEDLEVMTGREDGHLARSMVRQKARLGRLVQWVP
jgi:hypothetical protein